MEPNRVENALRRGIAYCVRAFESSGHWSDFCFFNQTSDEWVTGVTMNYLLDAGERCPQWLQTSASTFLASRARKMGGWGWGLGAGSDCDSTVACYAAVKNTAETNGLDVNLIANFVLEHHGANGGFSTYLPTSLLNSRPSFCLETPCVTANVLNYFSESLPESIRKRAFQYLLESEGKQGIAWGWKGLWWDGWAHTTCLVLRAFSKVDRDSFVERFLNSRKYSDASDHFQDDCIYPEGNSISDASILEIFGQIDPYEEISVSMLDKVLATQSLEGAWTSPSLLRFIQDDDSEPWLNPASHQYSPSTTNIYPTAFVCSVLSRLLQRNKTTKVRD